MAWYAHHNGLLVQAGLDFSDGGLQYIPDGSGLRTLTMSEVYDAPTGSQLCREKRPGRSWLRVLLGRVLSVVEVIKAWWCSHCDTALAVNVLSTEFITLYSTSILSPTCQRGSVVGLGYCRTARSRSTISLGIGTW
jgi:hypothetical protein